MQFRCGICRGLFYTPQNLEKHNRDAHGWMTRGDGGNGHYQSRCKTDVKSNAEERYDNFDVNKSNVEESTLVRTKRDSVLPASGINRARP